MAPLKRELYLLEDVDDAKYPWLKGHGSFEACLGFQEKVNLSLYPWLKGHGSFEAYGAADPVCWLDMVSMAERSWLL